MKKLTPIYIISIALTIAMLSSCAGVNKQVKTGNISAAELNAVKVVSSTSTVSEPAIKEVEEKLVSNNAIIPAQRYFVIIGSFRNPENAKKYQGQLTDDGFSSEIIKNEAGLYRVSVLATDEIESAREDIRRIRKSFPEYFDTWLLIQKK